MFLSDDRQWPAPATNPENEAFFAAAAQGRLLYGCCRDCGKVHYYPRRSCPHCFTVEVDWAEASGQGRIYSYTVTGPASDRQVLAFVELEEGFRVLSNIVDAAPGRLTVGAAVRVAFGRAGEVRVPVFVLQDAGAAA
ncbi:Zn-ribbon domain-containing OB-fold protein [Variovorax sp. RA8]|uniref:Zn-ribbon domain-containing OB-fold protein n=1 Tax=Variovorax sp. (strain JCM 16519 / RA8) TaxID=662548 RepID=UPI001318E7A2|nr:Zn-ribbon domain-containing OB-fold protein [Variovorax sp. RA8]VTU30866.1 putative nucleic-acid-binding protein containing a Zn-ribbon [Variovorax sp. RA8]